MTTDPSTEGRRSPRRRRSRRSTRPDSTTSRLIGSNEAETIEFYRDVLGMPLVLRQPNLDQPEVTHLFFDTGDGRILTFFVEDDRDSSRQPSGHPSAASTTSPSRSTPSASTR